MCRKWRVAPLDDKEGQRGGAEGEGQGDKGLAHGLRCVMPARVAGIHVLLMAAPKMWMAGTWASEATPFFERLCPAMTPVVAACRQ